MYCPVLASGLGGNVSVASCYSEMLQPVVKTTQMSSLLQQNGLEPVVLELLEPGPGQP